MAAADTHPALVNMNLNLPPGFTAVSLSTSSLLVFKSSLIAHRCLTACPPFPCPSQNSSLSFVLALILLLTLNQLVPSPTTSLTSHSYIVLTILLFPSIPSLCLAALDTDGPAPHILVLSARVSGHMWVSRVDKLSAVSVSIHSLIHVSKRFSFFTMTS